MAMSMLDRLRDNHQLEFLCDWSGMTDLRYQEKESPEAKENYVVFTAPYHPGRISHSFDLLWNWHGLKLRMDIEIDAQNPIQCNFIRVWTYVL